LSEYSSEVTSVLETLDSELDAEAENYASGPPSIEGAQEYVRIRVDGYRDAVAGIDALDPPDQVADLHRTLHEIMTKLSAAAENRAAFAGTVTAIDELDRVWEGPEAGAIPTAEAEAIILCHAAQSQFDATQAREDLADVPWMRSELKEVVLVALDRP
jgi:hypothetical protein